MKAILSGLVLASAVALGTAPRAEASPTSAVTTSALPGGIVRVGFGTGGYSRYSGGYYRTEMRWVQRTVLVGYDRFGRAFYEVRWFQEPYTVWVPVYRPVYRPSVSVGFGWRW